MVVVAAVPDFPLVRGLAGGVRAGSATVPWSVPVAELLAGRQRDELSHPVGHQRRGATVPVSGAPVSTGRSPVSGSRRTMSSTTSAAWPRTGVEPGDSGPAGRGESVGPAFDVLDRQSGGQPHSNALPDGGGSRPQQVRQLAVIGHRWVAAVEQSRTHPVPGAHTPCACGHVSAGGRDREQQHQRGEHDGASAPQGQVPGRRRPTRDEDREQGDLGAQPDQQPDDAGRQRPLRSQEQLEHARSRDMPRPERPRDDERSNETTVTVGGAWVCPPLNGSLLEWVDLPGMAARLSRWARGRPIRARDFKVAVPCPPVLAQSNVVKNPMSSMNNDS